MPPRRQNNQPQNPLQEYTARVIAQFRTYQPPTFNGQGEPTEAEEWLRMMDRTFAYMVCTDAQRIACTTFQLIGDADHWWETHRRSMTPEQFANMTWEGFKQAIMRKFLPMCYRDQKETEFLHLTQGNMTLNDYERKVNQLSRYAPHLTDTNEKKAHRFKRGLRFEISSIIACRGMTTYAETLERAQDVESSLRRNESRIDEP